MSVYQNINGTLTRMDASDLVQLAAVDTEGILGGTPGATTDGQTLVDQLAADDVQAQTDIGQIKTDLPNYLTITDEQVLGAWNLQPNRVSTQTIGEVTFTHNSDGTISYNSNGSAVSGTREYVITVRSGKIGDLNFLKNGVYYLSGGISSQVKLVPFSTQNNAYARYGEDTGNGLRFTVNGESASADGAYVGLVLQIRTGGAVSGIVKPMIALKPNMPYVPYVPTNRECMSYAVNGKIGAKNFANNTAATVTNNGVTFTVNADKTVTATNTASGGNAICSFNVTLDAGSYILTGGVDTNRFIQLYLAASPYTTVGYDTGRGLSFSVASRTTYTLLIGINNGTAADGCVFKPMIRLASDTDATYVPYAMTNAELTKVSSATITYENGISQQTAADKPLYKQGNICCFAITLTGIASTQGSWVSVGTLPTGFIPQKSLFVNVTKNGSSDVLECQLQSNGNIRLRDNSAAIASTDYIHFNGTFIA